MSQLSFPPLLLLSDSVKLAKKPFPDRTAPLLRKSWTHKSTVKVVPLFPEFVVQKIVRDLLNPSQNFKSRETSKYLSFYSLMNSELFYGLVPPTS